MQFCYVWRVTVYGPRVTARSTDTESEYGSNLQATKRRNGEGHKRNARIEKQGFKPATPGE